MSSFYIYLAESRDGEMCIKAGYGAKPEQRIKVYSKQYDLIVKKSRIWLLPKGQCRIHVEKEVENALRSMGFRVKPGYKSNDGKIAKEIYILDQLFEGEIGQIDYDYDDVYNYACDIADAVISYCARSVVDIQSIGKVNIEQLSKFNDLNYDGKIQAIEEFLASNKHYCEVEKKFPPWYELTYNNADIYESLKRISHTNKSFNLTIDSEINNKTVQIFNGPLFEQEGVVKFYIRDPRSFLNEKNYSERFHQSCPGFDWKIASDNFRLLEVNRNEDILINIFRYRASWYPCFYYYAYQLYRLFGALYELSRFETKLLVQDNQSNDIAIKCKRSVIEGSQSCFTIDGQHIVISSRNAPDDFNKDSFHYKSNHCFAQNLYLTYLVESRSSSDYDYKRSGKHYFFKKVADFGYKYGGFGDLKGMFKALFDALGVAIIFHENTIIEVLSALSYELNESKGEWESVYPSKFFPVEDDDD